MIRWIKAVIRHHVGEAFLAGIYDGMTAGDGTPALSDEQAAIALRAIIGGTDPLSVPPAEGTAASPPRIAGPGANGTPALTEGPRRGPGRPRKFQEPQGPQE